MTLSIDGKLIDFILFYGDAFEKELKEHELWVKSVYTEGKRANFRNAFLCGRDLSGRNLRRADFRGANLRGSRLMNSDFSYADFSGAYFFGSNITGSKFENSRFAGSDFSLSQVINNTSPTGEKNA